MKRLLSFLAMVSLLLLIPFVNGQGEDMELEADDFLISVDPSDPDQGVLQISGTFTPPDLGLLEQVTVTLDSNITEVLDNKETGRYWASNIYWAGAAGTSTKIFGRNDGPEKFTIELNPEKHDPQTDKDITVPQGLSLDAWGDLVVTASMSGAMDRTLKDTARIYPEEYYLATISTGTKDRNITAGIILRYNVNITNAGNLDSDMVFEIPILQDLEDEGWNITMEETDYTDMKPGDFRETNLTMVAPNMIPRSELRILTMTVETLQIDPDTNDPASISEIRINLNFIRSDNTQNHDDDDDGSNMNDTDDDDGKGNYILGGVVGIVLVLSVLGFLIVVIFRGRGGEGEEEEDTTGTHESMFRI
jgi:hypothetical protein